jgi:hypothetical protein
MSMVLEAVPTLPNPFIQMTDDELLAHWRKYATDADIAKGTADRIWGEVERRIALEKAQTPLGL